MIATSDTCNCYCSRGRIKIAAVQLDKASDWYWLKHRYDAAAANEGEGLLGELISLVRFQTTNSRTSNCECGVIEVILSIILLVDETSTFFLFECWHDLTSSKLFSFLNVEMIWSRRSFPFWMSVWFDLVELQTV